MQHAAAWRCGPGLCTVTVGTQLWRSDPANMVFGLKEQDFTVCLWAVKSSTQLPIKATVQAHTAGNPAAAFGLVLAISGGARHEQCAQRLTGTSLKGDRQDWNPGMGADCHDTAGLCTLQVQGKSGKPRQWQMNTISIYLSPCWVDLSTHVGPPPPINLYPVNKTTALALPSSTG